MDFTPILNQIYSALWFLIPIVVFAIVIKSAWFKGVMGELIVNLLLRVFLPKANYHLIKNVTLPTDDGTTQIDHIVISRYGIFVIETKNMKGWIFGTAKQAQWTQKIFKKSYKFQNPLQQNYKHTKALEQCLAINPTAIFSVIVFVGENRFKTNMPENVTYAMGCINYIKSKKDIILSAQEVIQIIDTIESGRLQCGFKTNSDHVKHVKQLVDKRSRIEEKNVCPKCNSAMVLREAKKGANAGEKFWGCSAFPKCRTLLKINPL